jgi:hypothetical protein
MECNKCHKDTKVCSCASSTTIGSPVQGPRGDKGQRGSRILTGDGFPSKALGFEGDFYLDTVTNEYYIKNEFCEWISEGNLTGQQGEQGIPGEGIPGENGIDGQDGQDGREVQLRNNGTHIQWKYEGDPDWINLVELTEIQGPQGDAGNDGCSLLQGIGAPDNSLGKDCDSYIDVDSVDKDFYLKSMGSWVKTGTLLSGAETGNFYVTNTADEDVTKFVSSYTFASGGQTLNTALTNALSNIQVYGWPIKFPEKDASPYFDDKNNWFVNKWESPKDYSIVEFNIQIVLNSVDPSSFPNASSGGVLLALVRSRGGVESIMTYLGPETPSNQMNGLSSAAFPKNVSIIYQVASVEKGDLYFLKVVLLVGTGLSGVLEPYTEGGDIYVENGSEFWNQTID